MPWGDATGTSGGFGRWTGDHRVCLFELWSSESSGSGTSADHSSALILNPTVGPQVATSDEQRAVRFAYKGTFQANVGADSCLIRHPNTP